MKRGGQGRGEIGDVPTVLHGTSKTSLAELRARIRVLEGGWEGGWERGSDLSGGTPPDVVPLGVPAIDDHLPDGGLRLAGLHEIAGAREEWDDALVAGFCLALLGRLAARRSREAEPASPVLWAARHGDLYGPGVAGLVGARAREILPGRLILVRARRDADLLWALEEGLRAPAGTLSAVVGEAAAPDDTALRRLQLAAETAGRPCFLLHRPLFAGRTTTPGYVSASAVALTRWRVGALPPEKTRSEMGLAGNLIGRPRWRLDLLRCRGAAPGSFTVEWDDATGGFALAAPLCDRPVVPGPQAAAAEPDRRAG